MKKIALSTLLAFSLLTPNTTQPSISTMMWFLGKKAVPALVACLIISMYGPEGVEIDLGGGTNL